MKLKKYRVVRDSYAGYEVQIWRIWWPFWIEVDFVNTHFTLERALDYIDKHRQKVVWKEGK